jgi:hypothetical protein
MGLANMFAAGFRLHPPGPRAPQGLVRLGGHSQLETRLGSRHLDFERRARRSGHR